MIFCYLLVILSWIPSEYQTVRILIDCYHVTVSGWSGFILRSYSVHFTHMYCISCKPKGIVICLMPIKFVLYWFGSKLFAKVISRRQVTAYKERVTEIKRVCIFIAVPVGNWQTSFMPCFKIQEIDLVSIGCNPEVLDNLRPDICFSEW